MSSFPFPQTHLQFGIATLVVERHGHEGIPPLNHTHRNACNLRPLQQKFPPPSRFVVQTIGVRILRNVRSFQPYFAVVIETGVSL